MLRRDVGFFTFCCAADEAAWQPRDQGGRGAEGGRPLKTVCCVDLFLVFVCGGVGECSEGLLAVLLCCRCKLLDQGGFRGVMGWAKGAKGPLAGDLEVCKGDRGVGHVWFPGWVTARDPTCATPISPL